MKQKGLSDLLRLIIVGTALCGGIFIYYLVPVWGKEIVAANPEILTWYRPWLIFIFISSVPCYAVLVYSWRIAAQIGHDNSFSRVNSKSLRSISLLAGANSAFFFIGNLAMLIFKMSHPGVFTVALFIVFAGIAVTVAAAALSHLVLKAALLREENEGVI